MRIGKKLTLGFTAIALLMVFVGAIYIYQNKSMQNITQREIYNSFSILNDSWELMEAIEHQQMAAVRYLLLQEPLEGRRVNYYYEKERFTKIYHKFYAVAGEHIKSCLEEFYHKVNSCNTKLEETFILFEQGTDLKILEERIKEAEAIEAEAHKILWKIISHVQNAHVEPAKADIASKINSTIKITIASVIASLLLSIGLGFYLTRSISGPITHLKETMIKIGPGNLDTKVDIPSRDEIGILAKAFNQMLRDLKKSHQDLENVLASLEERVKDRTAELTKSELAKSKMIEDLDKQAKELREAQDKLVRSEKLAAIGQLAASVAHELRNPLGVMKNIVYYFNLLKWDKDNLNRIDIKDITKNLTILSSEIDNADKVISDLLEFTNIKKPVLHKENINIIVKETLNRLQISDSIELMLELDSLPNISVDALHIRQVFDNIIINALQAMERGGELKIKTSQQVDFIMISFTDTGSGIPEENLERIFEPLFTTKAKGTGLGLSVCTSLIEKHKGKLEVKSEAGKGTTFIVYLPIDLKNRVTETA